MSRLTASAPGGGSGFSDSLFSDQTRSLSTPSGLGYVTLMLLLCVRCRLVSSRESSPFDLVELREPLNELNSAFHHCMLQFFPAGAVGLTGVA